MAKSEPVFFPFGHGAQVAVEADFLTVRIPIGAVARKAAPPSSSGKTQALANSGGHQLVPGTDIKLNLWAGFPLRTPPAS